VHPTDVYGGEVACIPDTSAEAFVRDQLVSNGNGAFMQQGRLTMSLVRVYHFLAQDARDFPAERAINRR